MTESQGKISQSGFLDPKAVRQRRANQPLRPDEVLFKKTSAPTRYEETDYYFAHNHLPENQRLPDGELLGALHAYVSKLYSRKQKPGQRKVWKCMDETALVALGILIEEMAKETLGETGDLALVEAANSEEEAAVFANEGKRAASSSEHVEAPSGTTGLQKSMGSSSSDVTESDTSPASEDEEED